MSNQSINQKDIWDKAHIVSFLLIPVVVALIGVLLNSAIKTNEIQSEYVKLAITAMQSPDTTKAGRELKKWAFNILNEMSPVPIPPTLEAEALGIQLFQPEFRTGGGFGQGWGFVKIYTIPEDEYFIFIDGIVRATTPATLNLRTGFYTIEFQDSRGRKLREKVIELSDDSTLSVILCKSTMSIMIGESKDVRIRSDKHCP